MARKDVSTTVYSALFTFISSCIPATTVCNFVIMRVVLTEDQKLILSFAGRKDIAAFALSVLMTTARMSLNTVSVAACSLPFMQ